MYLEQRDSKFIQEACNGFNNLMFVKTKNYKKIISKMKEDIPTRKTPFFILKNLSNKQELFCT